MMDRPPDADWTPDTTALDVGVPLADAARMLGISPDAARKRLERGTLRGHKVGGRWIVSLDLDASPTLDETDMDATRTPMDAPPNSQAGVGGCGADRSEP
jgi:hypothetical protein